MTPHPQGPPRRGGAICACLVLVAGLVLITVRGPRESGPRVRSRELSWG